MEIAKVISDISDFVKSIGTSSSVTQEQDENSVENYVRNGGNTMENTTEPDPKGDIAVTKSFPDAKSDEQNLINQTTRPEGDVTVTDAAQGPVPTNATFDGEGSAVAPTSEEMNEPTEEPIAKAEGDKCPSCGQAVPVTKSDDSDEDDIAKSDDADADDLEKAEDAKEDPIAEEKEDKEMKKSLWGGAFAPIK